MENQEKKADDSKQQKVPKGFFEFIYSKHYMSFIESLLEYCREVFRLEHHYHELGKETKEKDL